MTISASHRVRRHLPALLLVTATTAAVAGVLGLVATGALADHPDAEARIVSVSAARTAFPGLVPAAGEPQLPSLASARPQAGAAVQATGPFDDRFTMTGLSFNGTTVTTTVSITSDVSDILEFEALAGFYDANGQLLGTSSFTHHQGEAATNAHAHTGPPEEVQKLQIRVPDALRGKAVSAAVGVPVLVNE